MIYLTKEIAKRIAESGAETSLTESDVEGLDAGNAHPVAHYYRHNGDAFIRFFIAAGVSRYAVVPESLFMSLPHVDTKAEK